MYVSTSQVQRPCNVVQCRHQHAVGMLCTQLLPDTCQFGGNILTRQLQRLYHDGLFWHSRSVFPDALQRVEIGSNGDAALTSQLFHQLLHLGSSRRHAVYADGLVVGISQFPAYPFGDGRRTVHLLFHQHVLRTFQLLGSSNEVARVRPQGSTLQRHHRSTCRTVKAAYPLTTFPMVCRIFTMVRV